jgi:hypothetical protein
MLRMVNHMVDSYLDLRRLLTRHLGTLQQELLDPKQPLPRLAACCSMRATRCTCWKTCARTSAARCRSGSTRWTSGRRGRRRPAPRTRAAARALARRARARGTRAHACAPARAVGRDRGADALLGAGPPHQRHHAHADRADRGVPAAEPDHRLLRHELRRPAADPLGHRHLDRGGPDVAGVRRLSAFFWRKRYLGTQRR